MDWQFAFERSEMMREFQTELLTSISHELRNPLSSQMGSLQMILTDLCDSAAEEREYVGAAKQSVENMLKLLDDLTTLARHHLPITNLQTQPLSIQPIIKQVYALTILQAQDQGIQYDWPLIQAQPDPVLHVDADPHGLTQALLGICRWTIRHMNFGVMSLKVTQVSGSLDPSPATAERHSHQIQFDLKAVGRSRHLTPPDNSLVWQVSRRLLTEMGGELILLASGDEGHHIQALLPQSSSWTPPVQDPQLSPLA